MPQLSRTKNPMKSRAEHAPTLPPRSTHERSRSHGGPAATTRIFHLHRKLSDGKRFTVAGFPGDYLSGYCHLQEAERTFLVARMSEVAAVA